MKNVKKTAAALTALLMLCTMTLNALAVVDYGASAVEENQTYTIEQMLTYAIQDEYLAYERYKKDIERFGEQRPFTNIVRAESTHIMLLRPLFEKNNLPVPVNRAADYLTVPDSLIAALKAGVEGESLNMRMYELFLKQDLPRDIRTVFTLLRNAAENHLRAFERAITRVEGGGLGRNR